MQQLTLSNFFIFCVNLDLLKAAQIYIANMVSQFFCASIWFLFVVCATLTAATKHFLLIFQNCCRSVFNDIEMPLAIAIKFRIFFRNLKLIINKFLLIEKFCFDSFEHLVSTVLNISNFR